MGLEEKLVLVDYKTNTSGTSFKIVQLVLMGVHYSIIGDLKHSSLLEKFLKEKEVQYKKTKARTGPDIPVVEGERYKVEGMGLHELQDKMLHNARQAKHCL
jgi:hypothetical protein